MNPDNWPEFKLQLWTNDQFVEEKHCLPVSIGLIKNEEELHNWWDVYPFDDQDVEQLCGFDTFKIMLKHDLKRGYPHMRLHKYNMFIVSLQYV
jgi:hypothetical protein